MNAIFVLVNAPLPGRILQSGGDVWLPRGATNGYGAAMSLRKLSREDRLRLMRFVCSFAWADLEVKKSERALVAKMAKKLGLEEDEIAEVKKWLQVPPRAEDVDPQSIPPAQRKLFLDAAREMIAVDGEIDPEERESFSIFEQLLQ